MKLINLINESFQDDVAKSTYEWGISHGGVLTPSSEPGSQMKVMQRLLTDKQAKYCKGGGQFKSNDNKNVIWKRSTGNSILFFVS